MSLPLPLFLGATKQLGEIDYNVTEIEPEEALSTGVMLRAYGRGIVPIYEEHLARLSKNISLENWMTMQPLERAIIVAMRRIENAIENQRAEAERRKIKSESRNT